MKSATVVFNTTIKRKSAELFYATLYGQIYLIFFHGICDTVGASFASTIFTYAYYIYILLSALYCLLLNRGKALNKLITYFLIMLFFAFNCLFGRADTSNYFTLDMLLIYFAILPVCIFALSEIRDWDKIFVYGETITNITIGVAILAFVMSVFSSNNIYGSGDNINYMQLSYAVMPCLCMAYASVHREHRTITLIGISITTILMLLYGSRACAGYFFAFIVLYILFCSTNKQTMKRIVFMVVLLVGILLTMVFSEDLINLAAALGQRYNSRTLISLGKAELFESTVRDQLYARAKEAVTDMGFHIYGLFGDRYTVGKMYNNSYVHSIIYEMILSFGIIFGIVILACIVALIVKCFRCSRNVGEKKIVLVLVCSLLARFIFSGSFVSFPSFYVFIVLMLSMRQNQRRIRDGKYIVRSYESVTSSSIGD